MTTQHPGPVMVTTLEGPLPGSHPVASWLVLTGWEGQASSLGLIREALMPILKEALWWPSPSQVPTCSHNPPWGLGFQHTNVGEHVFSDHSHPSHSLRCLTKLWFCPVKLTTWSELQSVRKQMWVDLSPKCVVIWCSCPGKVTQAGRESHTLKGLPTLLPVVWGPPVHPTDRDTHRLWSEGRNHVTYGTFSDNWVRKLDIFDYIKTFDNSMEQNKYMWLINVK